MQRPFHHAVTVSALVVLMSPTAALAQTYPERPITFLVPFGAGGGTDIAVRTYAPYLEDCIDNGASFVVVNRPGASGIQGFTELATAEPDGYMIATLNAPNVEVGAITRDSYTLDQFELLGNIVGTNVTLAVDIDSDIETLDDLIAAAEAADPPLNLGMASIGADDHLMALRFASMADVEFNILPLESAGNVRTAILGGHVVVGSISNTETSPFMDQLRVLAVASTERLDSMADVPTFRELGYDLVAGSNHVLGTTARVPEEIVDTLASCIAEVAANPGFLAEAEERAISLNVMGKEEVEEFIANEAAQLRELWETDPWQ